MRDSGQREIARNREGRERESEQKSDRGERRAERGSRERRSMAGLPDRGALSRHASSASACLIHATALVGSRTDTTSRTRIAGDARPRRLRG
eukprot:scaffold16778_cov129-Isochrysis_galbana.AAC.2